MRLAFDTSVVVAALLEGHPHHRRVQPWVEGVATGDLGTVSVAWHAAAETWSVLTRLPGSLRLSPATATLLVERALSVFRPVDAIGADYQNAMRRCSERGLRSGVLFDALHLVVAERLQADAFITLNAADFTRLAGSGSPRIVTPPDPPAVSL